METETKKAEKEARKDRIRAQRELNNERYFQYEAKMAEETEARVRACMCVVHVIDVIEQDVHVKNAVMEVQNVDACTAYATV